MIFLMSTARSRFAKTAAGVVEALNEGLMAPMDALLVVKVRFDILLCSQQIQQIKISQGKL